MPFVFTKQAEISDRLFEQVRKNRPGVESVWQLRGAAGTGKTTTLLKLKDRLRREGLHPILVAAPADEPDASAIALVELAGGLKQEGLVNGETEQFRDLKIPSRQKLEIAKSWVERNSDQVVLLCDEPGLWDNPGPEAGDPTNRLARELMTWIAGQARCRRVIAGWFPYPPSHVSSEILPRLDQATDFLRDATQWGALAPLAEALARQSADDLRATSPFLVKLLVALAATTSLKRVSEKIPTLGESEALAELLEALTGKQAGQDLCCCLSSLAMARGPTSTQLLPSLSVPLLERERSILVHCLSVMNDGLIDLHSMVRYAVRLRFKGRMDERGADRIGEDWRFDRAGLARVHQKLADYYTQAPPKIENRLRCDMEAFYHSTLSSKRADLNQLLPFFPEQFHAAGRALSYVAHDHEGAVAVFEHAVELFPHDDYVHHYLAFNLDWLAKDAHRVEHHYQRAIDLYQDHPWWWSRWISYLVTRGRPKEARATWQRALDTLNVSEGESPDSLYNSLHKWVARWLLHWAQLDFAEKVLRSVPCRLRKEDLGFRALEQLLHALREAANGAAVFPLTVKEPRWTVKPHLGFQDTFRGQRMTTWRPARVRHISRHRVDLEVGEQPAGGEQPETGFFEFSRDEVELAAENFRWSDLQPDRFVELAFYGESGLMRIRMHESIGWFDPELPPLAPPPNRWIRATIDSE